MRIVDKLAWSLEYNTQSSQTPPPFSLTSRLAARNSELVAQPSSRLRHLKTSKTLFLILPNTTQFISTSTKHADRPDRQALCDQCSKINLRHYLAPQKLRLLWGVFPGAPLSDALSLERAIDTSSSIFSCALCRTLARSTQHILGAQIDVLSFVTGGNTQTLENYPTTAYFMKASIPTSLRIAPLAEDSFRLGTHRHNYGRLCPVVRSDRTLVVQWLRRCEANHKACSTIKDVAAPNLRAPQYVVDCFDMRIKETDGEEIRYLALSYVWGGGKSLQLLNENLAILKVSQSLRDHWENLSKVIRDAITFAREIGERFLWTDALCICQNDASTKHDQIFAMNTIYAKAVMTLVALEGDASYGLPGVEPYPKPRHQHIETVHGLRIMTIMPDLIDLEVDSAWRSRAWTYQEEQFSRRMLFFTDHQVYFRCQTACYSEDRWEENDPAPLAKRSAATMRIRVPLNEDYNVNDFAFVLWRQMVENFSLRQFSFQVDRYLAFAGLQNELSLCMRYPCIFGMPIQSLVYQLYWAHISSPSHLVHRIAEYPSWSWCGWTGGVASPRTQILFNIHEIELTHVVSLPYQSDGKLASENEVSTLVSALDCTHPSNTLAFSALAARMPLDISHHATTGFILITPKPGKVCGIIQALHLPTSTLASLSSTTQCIMLGSCHVADTVDACQFDTFGISTMQDWFQTPTNIQPLKALPVSHAAAHEPNSSTGKPLQVLRRASTILQAIREDENEKDRVTWWGAIGWSGIRKFGGWVLQVFYVLLALCGLILALAFGIPLVVVVIIVVLVVMLTGFIYQNAYNHFSHTRKWYFWKSVESHRWLQMIMKDYSVDLLPDRWQEWIIFRCYGTPANYEDVETNGAEAKEDKIKVVNLMLICKSNNGDNTYHRLAIGAMSAACWEECNPVQQRIILE